MKKMLITLIMCGLTFHLSGCSSGDTDEGGDESAAAKSAAGDEMSSAAQDPGADANSADAAKDPAADPAANSDDPQAVAQADGDKKPDDLDGMSLDTPAEGDKVADASGANPEDPLSAVADAAATDPNAAPAPDQAGATPPAEVNKGQAAGATPDQPTPGDQAAAPAPSPDAGAVASTEPSPVPIVGDTSGGGDKPKSVATLQKVKDTPFEKGGVLLNTVYVARPGDTTKSIAQKVYGSGDRAKDLKAANAILKSRAPKTGDKIYYNSANRPDDAERMLTYYEDQNIAPQIYTSTTGDDLKTVGKTLLGNKESWKEIWATNDVQSKGALDEGTQIRYWPDDAGAQANAGANKKGADKVADITPPVQAALPPPPAPPMPSAMPPAPMPGQDAASMGSTTPPPAPAAAVMTPPPPPLNEPPAPPVASAPKAPKAPQASEGLFGLSDDNLMYLAAGGALLIGGALVMAIKKKKDASRFSEGQTQI